jgi:hypothetical protein
LNSLHELTDYQCFLAGIFGVLGGIQWIYKRFPGDHWLAFWQVPGIVFLAFRFIVPSLLYFFLSSDALFGKALMIGGPGWLKPIAFGASFELFLHSRFYLKVEGDRDVGQGPFDLLEAFQNQCIQYIGDRMQLKRKEQIDALKKKIVKRDIRSTVLISAFEHSIEVLHEPKEKMILHEIIQKYKIELAVTPHAGLSEKQSAANDHELAHKLVTDLRANARYATWQLLTNEFLKETAQS